MGAIERKGYVFEPEYSVIQQNGSVHVYHNSDFVDELTFSFTGKAPELGQIEQIVEEYCKQKGI